MAKQVGPRRSKPEQEHALRGRHKDEAFSGEFHQGQRTWRPPHRLMVWTPAPFGATLISPISGRTSMPALTIGLDIAKNVFQVYGV
ncbi:hypothetical protein ACFQ3P_41990, partial [Paraburkholderia sabiae]